MQVYRERASHKIFLVARLVVFVGCFFINVDLAIFQPYLDFEAGDNQSLKIQVARRGIEPRSSCSASQELNHSATAAPCCSIPRLFCKTLAYKRNLLIKCLKSSWSLSRQARILYNISRALKLVPIRFSFSNRALCRAHFEIHRIHMLQ